MRFHLSAHLYSYYANCLYTTHRHCRAYHITHIPHFNK
jgi:hypothetical protein